MPQKIQPMALRGCREAMMAPTTEKVSTVARLRTALSSAASLPYVSSTAEPDPAVRANAIPPKGSATDSTIRDQASQEAARDLLRPAAESCPIVPSVTISLYRTSVSQTLRHPLRSQAVRELLRTPSWRSSRRRESLHRATPIGQGRRRGDARIVGYYVSYVQTRVARGVYIRRPRAGEGLRHGAGQSGKAKSRSPVGPWPVDGERWAG